MIFETFALLGIISICLMGAGAFGKLSFPPMFASVLVMFLGLWILLDGISIQTGTAIATNQTTIAQCPGLCELENMTSTETTTATVSAPQYTEITWPFESVMNFRHFFGIFLFFLALAGFFAFIFAVKPEN